jgi:hypothetical protein
MVLDESIKKHDSMRIHVFLWVGDGYQGSLSHDFSFICKYLYDDRLESQGLKVHDR